MRAPRRVGPALRLALCRSRGARSASPRALGRDTTDGGLDQWRAWSAQKLPGRPACKYVRGWEGAPLSIEVHRTACIVTHPPGGEGANDALVNPANERLAGTRFTPDECWLELYGDPTSGAALSFDDRYLTYPFQTIDGLVTDFGGEALRCELED